VAILIGLASGPARGEAPKEPPPATPPAEQPAATPPAAGTEMKAYKGPFTLPASCRKADGTYDQEAVVEAQRNHLAVINAKLGTQMVMIETPHFLIFSDADVPKTKNFIQWCEPLYAALCSQFGFKPGDRVWNGKCLLLLFKTQETFKTFASIFDKAALPNDAAGYYSPERYPPLLLMHIAMFVGIFKDSLSLQQLFVHEGTHAFFHAYCGDTNWPLWLTEGLAMYMQALINPASRSKQPVVAIKVAQSERSIQYLINAGENYYLSNEDYAVANSLVDCLIKADRAKFKKFVDLLKENKGQEEALNATYGFGLEELEKRWRQALTVTSPGGRRR
jgi:hypothetical protein